jgi:hypothetical protein
MLSSERTRAELHQGRPRQGDLASLDDATRQENGQLSRQMRGQPFAADAPIIWGSIRIFSVYGKWSFWRSPKRK